jgi:hypothetical protein
MEECGLTRDLRFRGFPWHISALAAHEEKRPLHREGWGIFSDLDPRKRQPRSLVRTHDIRSMIDLRRFLDGHWTPILCQLWQL